MLHYPKWWQVVGDNASFWCAPLLGADPGNTLISYRYYTPKDSMQQTRDIWTWPLLRTGVLRAVKVVRWMECRSRSLGLQLREP